MKQRKFILLALVTIFGLLVLSACNGEISTDVPVEEHAETAVAAEQTDDDEHAEVPTEEHDDGDEHDEASAEEHDDADEHDDGEEDEHAPDAHSDIPEEAAAVPNPIENTEESIELGAELYAASCAVCHGENGEGDGPGGVALDPKPTDLLDDHVQEVTDGALFYIISHGIPETSMPAWEDVLDETQRWHVVNFVLNLDHE